VTFVLMVLALYTFTIMYTVSHQAKLDKALTELNAARKAMHNAMNQVENLDEINETLRLYIDSIKAENALLRNGINAGESGEIQYESHTYKNNKWESYLEYVQEDIDFDK